MQRTPLTDIADRIASDAVVAVTEANRRRADRVDDGLDAAAVLLGAVDRLIAAVIVVLQSAGHVQVIADHGITRDTWLRAIAHRTGSDAGMLLAAAERLADMPAVSAWFQQGTLSWGAVRAIVASTRNLTAAQRSWVDETLADHDGVERLDGDQVTSLVDGLVDRARPELHRDREASALSRRWLVLQPRLGGTVDVHGCLDVDTGAAALSAFAAMTAPDADVDDTHGMSGGDIARTTRRRANVDIFGDLCRQRLARAGAAPDRATAIGDRDAGDGAADAEKSVTAAGRTAAGRCSHRASAPSTARPALLVVADVAALDPNAPAGSGAARLHWATSRAPVELTPAGAQRLACDATMRVVFTDDTDVLGVTAAHPKVSASLRAALAVRDGGCRFPTCTQPPELCDAHHIVPVAAGGTTCLDNLALICRDHHHAIHDSGWRVTLHDSAAMTFTRRGATLCSQPRAVQHPRPGQPPPSGRPTRPRSHPPPSMAASRADTAPSPSDPARELLPF